MERREPSLTVGGKVNCYSHYGEANGDSSKKENRSTIQFSNLISGYLSEENENTNFENASATPHSLQYYL